MSMALVGAIIGGTLYHFDFKSKASSINDEYRAAKETSGSDKTDVEYLISLNDSELMNTLSDCTDEELNRIIDNSKTMYYVYLENENKNVATAGKLQNTEENGSDDVVTSGLTGPVSPGEDIATIATLKVAWLAAAEIASDKYPCASKLIMNSVFNIDYSENTKSDEKLFTPKIKKDSYYKDYLEKYDKWKKTGEIKKPNGIIFKKGDLFYALNKVDCSMKKNDKKKTVVTISDTFDFALEIERYKSSPFVGIVNNWAWLCQNSYVLHSIKVNIKFYR